MIWQVRVKRLQMARLGQWAVSVWELVSRGEDFHTFGPMVVPGIAVVVTTQTSETISLIVSLVDISWQNTNIGDAIKGN